MKSPKDMRIIQIDVTNACIHRCSNCTRFCGHHKTPFYMSFETFKKAVDSLDGYVGTIGIMGGEPTLHPKFERMAEYLAQKRPPLLSKTMIHPQLHFMDAVHDVEMEHTFAHPCLGSVRQTVNGPGLWSSIGENYKKYYETIQDTMQYQALNDHINTMYHQPALVTRRALQIPDDEWFAIRDNCWVQNIWSASVTPKGAFFCEVAAALDMLFDGPGGWKIEPGWWKKTPEEFGEQLHWCELCGLACDTFMRDANEEIYDVSPDMYQKLVEIGSPLAGTGRINILDIKNGKMPEENKAASRRFSESMPYTESSSARYNEGKTNLMYKKFAGIIVCPDISLVSPAVENLRQFSEAYVYAPERLIDEIKRQTPDNTCVKYYKDNAYTLGYVLYEALKEMDYNRYALVLSGNITLNHLLIRMEKLVLNPGTLLYSSFREELQDDYFQVGPGSEAALLNGIAHSIQNIGWDTVLQVQNLDELVKLWYPEKLLKFSPESEHLTASSNIVDGTRYAVYGAGRTLQEAIQKIENGNAHVTAIIDSSKKKIGTEICGFTIQSPQYLVEHRDQFDKIMISVNLYYREIKERILHMGFSEAELAWV